MDEAYFWSSLERRLGREFAGMLDLRLKDLWCDGFMPSQYLLNDVQPRIIGKAWIGNELGKDEWDFALLLLGPVSSREEINWSSHMPAENMTCWLGVDKERKYIEIEAAAAVPDTTDPVAIQETRAKHRDQVAVFTGRDYTTIAYFGEVVLTPTSESPVYVVFINELNRYCLVTGNALLPLSHGLANDEPSVSARPKANLTDRVYKDFWKSDSEGSQDIVVCQNDSPPWVYSVERQTEIAGFSLNFIEIIFTRVVDYISGECRRFGNTLFTFDLVPSVEATMSLAFSAGDNIGPSLPFAGSHVTFRNSAAAEADPVVWLEVIREWFSRPELRSFFIIESRDAE